MRLSLFFLTLLATYASQICANRSKHWAVLVAGSQGWDNYRHQSDVAHAYQLVRQNGIPPQNIITMMVDDVASYREGPNDKVFIYMADHGSSGRFHFPTEKLQAQVFIQTLVWLNQARRYKRMLIYIEACSSGSMFEGLLPPNIKNQVHLFQLKRRLSVNQSPEQLELARRRLNRATQLARMARETVDDIVEQVYRSVTPSNPRIDIYEVLDCHNTITEQFEIKCFSPYQVPEAVYEMSKFYRLCELGYDTKSVVQEIFDRCG
ncbi:unnamed protein product [Echinostoma caproni]|uniref:Legumain n=1 Tax=Echinostoma caproni TaxID=27848 RepID=A0A183A8Z7_9TREM|nr:unnamed protein product [Echinostoma caproni]